MLHITASSCAIGNGIGLMRALNKFMLFVQFLKHFAPWKDVNYYYFYVLLRTLWMLPIDPVPLVFGLWEGIIIIIIIMK